jgi:hypothetical protein
MLQHIDLDAQPRRIFNEESSIPQPNLGSIARAAPRRKTSLPDKDNLHLRQLHSRSCLLAWYPTVDATTPGTVLISENTQGAGRAGQAPSSWSHVKLATAWEWWLTSGRMLVNGLYRFCYQLRQITG